MSFSITLPRSFKRSLKRLSKKYPRAKDDVKLALQVLSDAPTLGVLIPGGAGTRKLRVRSTDLQRGKQPDVTRRELKQLLADLNTEL